MSTTAAPPEVIDADAVTVIDAPSRELVPIRHGVLHEVIRPLDPQQVVESMRTHQELLRKILDPSDWQGEADKSGSFVKKSGWRKVALAYNLTLGRVSEEVERNEDGVPQRATYTAYAEAPNGRRMEASGHCAFAESRFSGPRGNASKLENDMRATAETRAKNRAISDLIGMGKVSAEEVDAGTSTGPPFGPPIAEDQKGRLRDALRFLVALDDATGDADMSVTGVPSVDDLVKGVADDIMGLVAQYNDGNAYMPQIVATALLKVAGTRQKHAQAWRDPKAPNAPETQEPQTSRRATAPAPAVDPEQAARIVAAEAAVAQILNIGDGHDELRREADRRMRAINCGPEQIQRMLQEAGGSDGLHKLLGRIPASAPDSATTRKAA